ncbi:hypothetical protein, partial [Streptococcus suis]|uniref:hypothetical protein n=1 Tax=Streptococcus suis TaxID=1307 RepID=UPI0037D26DA2
ALKQPFFSKNSKKDKHQNDVCLQSETTSVLEVVFGCLEGSFLYITEKDRKCTRLQKVETGI